MQDKCFILRQISGKAVRTGRGIQPETIIGSIKRQAIWKNVEERGLGRKAVVIGRRNGIQIGGSKIEKMHKYKYLVLVVKGL